MTIGERIMLARKTLHMTQEQLAKEVGVKREVVTHWENDTRGLKPRHIIKLSNALGVSCDYILMGMSGHSRSFYDIEEQIRIEERKRAVKLLAEALEIERRSE